MHRSGRNLGAGVPDYKLVVPARLKVHGNGAVCHTLRPAESRAHTHTHENTNTKAYARTKNTETNTHTAPCWISASQESGREERREARTERDMSASSEHRSASPVLKLWMAACQRGISSAASVHGKRQSPPWYSSAGTFWVDSSLWFICQRKQESTGARSRHAGRPEKKKKGGASPEKRGRLITPRMSPWLLKRENSHPAQSHARLAQCSGSALCGGAPPLCCVAARKKAQSRVGEGCAKRTKGERGERGAARPQVSRWKAKEPLNSCAHEKMQCRGRG